MSNFKSAFGNENDNENENIVEEKKTMEDNDLTVEAIRKQLEMEYELKRSKKTVEETHTRSTFLFRNDLAKRLDKLSRGKRGFKTMFLNKAIETLLDQYEKK